MVSIVLFQSESTIYLDNIQLNASTVVDVKNKIYYTYNRSFNTQYSFYIY